MGANFYYRKSVINYLPRCTYISLTLLVAKMERQKTCNKQIELLKFHDKILGGGERDEWVGISLASGTYRRCI